MEFAEHLTTLLAQGRSLSATVRRAGPDAVVPPCPDWTVRDLVVHLGGVYRWCATIVDQARTEFPSREERAGFAAGAADASPTALVDWLDEGLEAVADAIARAEPSLSCVTILPGLPPRDFWARRMAHETLVHRADAEIAAGGPVGRIEPDLAVDGLAELLEDFLPVRAGRRLVADPPRTLAVVTDEGPRWDVRVGPEGPAATRAAGSGGGVDLSLAGPAAALHLVLWNRADASTVRADGDDDVLALWRSAARI